MKTINFPYIAVGLGLFLMLIVLTGSQGEKAIPLLTLLFINEFAFVVTAIGAYAGIKKSLSLGFKPVNTIVSILCIALSAGFMVLGIGLWPA